MSPAWLRALDRYLVTGAAYGFGRKATQLTFRDEVQVLEDGQVKRAPLLIAEKVCVLGLGTLLGAAWLPYFVCKDLARLELLLRGRSLAAHGYEIQTRSLYEHVMD